MAVDNQAKIMANAILEILKDEPTKVFSLSGIAQIVIHQTGYSEKETNRIKVICNTLIAAGSAGGKHDSTISYKKREETGGFSSGDRDMGETKEEEKQEQKGFSDIRESAYKKENEKLKQDIETHRQAVAELGKKLKTEQEAAESIQKQLTVQLEEAKGKTRVVSVQLLRGEKKVKSFEGIFHKEFEKVLKLAQARMNIFVYGATGCGKSHMCKQVANSLDLPFYFVSCTAGMGESTLGGRLLPIGKANKFEYVASEFIQAYENGGVFLLDEMDAADANVLLLINSALANGRVAVTNRPDKPYAERHPDFICIAAANTVGTGADRMYSGRHKLDASTLDRFSIGKVFMDYDPRVEELLCPDDILRNVLLSYRKKIDGARLERAMSTRFMRDAYKMKSEFGYTLEDINEAYFQGWRDDERGKVKSPW